MNSYIMTFDIGTSSCKAVLFSSNGDILASGRGSYPIYRHPDGRVEQDMAEIMQGIDHCIEELRLAGWRMDRVAAISVSSQIASHCLVTRDGKILTPIYSWMDQRAMPQVDAYNACFSQQDTLRLTGMDMLITPAHTISKLRWMRENMGHVLEKADLLAQIKDVFIHRLTGAWVSDPTSYKGIVNQETGDVIPEIMEFTGCSPSLIPRIIQPYEQAGCLLKGVKGFEDFRPGIPVIVGWNDMNAAFLGMCGIADGCIGLDLTGTSEHIGIVAEHIPDDFVCNGVNMVPFLQKQKVCYGVTSSGGQAFDWFMKNIWGDATSEGYERLLGQVAQVQPEEVKNLIFLPYLEGERNPWNAPGGRGVFFGLDGRHNRLHMAYAVMEGVCFALKTIMDRMPMQPDSIVVAGGAARNVFWNQMKADILQIPYRKLHTSEAGCNGAAILAISGLQEERTIADIAGTMNRTECTYQPRLAYAAQNDCKYHRFLKIYQDLFSSFEVKEP